MKSSLALAGIHPVKRRVAAAAAVAASAWPLPAPRCMPAVRRLPTVWPPGPDFIQERILLPRRHVPPPCHTLPPLPSLYAYLLPRRRRRVTELPPLVLLCTYRGAPRVWCSRGLLYHSTFFFLVFWKAAFAPEAVAAAARRWWRGDGGTAMAARRWRWWRRGDCGGGELTSTAYGLCRDFQHDNDYTLATYSARPS